MNFRYLLDHQAALPAIADWYFDQWGHLSDGETLERSVERLHDYLHRDRIPFMLLGMEDDEVCAVAQLKFREMGDMYPDKEHWLGGVFVPPRYRGHGFGAAVATEIAMRAPACGVEVLHLQTERLDGGLYARLGWEPVEQVNNHGLEVLVMERHLGV